MADVLHFEPEDERRMLSQAIEIGERNLDQLAAESLKLKRLRFAVSRSMRLMRTGRHNDALKMLEETMRRTR